jgi:micrococcal nuclease
VSARRPRRRDDDRVRRSVIVAFVLVLSLALSGCADSSGSTGPHEPTALSATVAYAVDGDTLRVRLPDGSLEYVRLVGIDTPEDVKPDTPVECGGRAAASSMDRLAPEGAAVRLLLDSVADEHDRYGRLLAHAFIDGRQLEVAQLRRGWAEVYRYDGQRFDGLARFDQAQASARRAGSGVWGRCGGDFHSSR